MIFKIELLTLHLIYKTNLKSFYPYKQNIP